ncbi:MAG: hypothetical protein ACR2RE_27775 [Geminicoccaceae bacterium]
MARGAGYPIEEFLEAVTAQLDKTQDALRLKAVNRPMTFALKDFDLDLKVFVEMDSEGRVTFRPSGPNEEGASTVSIGFTTITRPMIEENTISMEMTRTETLDELGLGSEEQRQLARIGVRNAAQLRNLEQSAGEDTLSRHTGVNLARIRGALDLARPRLDGFIPEDQRPRLEPMPEPDPAPPPVNGQITSDPRPDRQPPIRTRPVDGGLLANRIRAGATKPIIGRPIQDPVARRGGPDTVPVDVPKAPSVMPGKIQVAPDARQIRLGGRNLIDQGRLPLARLDGRPLGVLEASATSVAFALPAGFGPGRLTVEMPDGHVDEFDLAIGSFSAGGR